MRVPVVRFVLAGGLALAAYVPGLLAADTGTLACDPQPTCEDRCKTHAVELFKTCIDGGADPAQCEERARAAMAACVQENCEPDPTCEDRCRAHAEEFLRNCIESVNDPDACAERARTVLAVCVEEHCMTVPTCEDRCKAHADELYQTCVAGGGDPTQCAERARTALAACVQENCDLCLCPPGFEPVCGVDGKTYGSPCEARCAHVAVAYEGECKVPCRCNAECPAGNVCRDGVCSPPCDIRCVVADPVCGTDGHTYDCGAVDAACHGVAVLHRGECVGVCRADADCRAGSVCTALRDCPTACGCASFCQACACPRVFDPVCGVDGRTYASPCLARCAHVEVAYKGVCRVVRRIN